MARRPPAETAPRSFFILCFKYLFGWYSYQEVETARLVTLFILEEVRRTTRGCYLPGGLEVILPSHLSDEVVDLIVLKLRWSQRIIEDRCDKQCFIIVFGSGGAIRPNELLIV